MNNIDEKKEPADQHNTGIDVSDSTTSLVNFSVQPRNIDSSISDSSEQLKEKNSINYDHLGNALESTAGTMKTNTSNTLDITGSTACEGIGNILRNARVVKGMSIDDVSRQLRLSAAQIEAIEREDFEKLPGRTFLRGFIRNYANLLQLDSSSLLKMLPVSVRVLSTQKNTPLRDKQISFSSNRKNTQNYSLPIIAILIIFMLGAYFFFGNESRQDEKDEVSTVKEMPSAKSSGTTKEIHLPLAVVPKDSREGASPQQLEFSSNTTSVALKLDLTPALAATESKSAVQTDDVVAVPIEPNTGNLQFRFNADSWIRVVDGGGVTLIEQIKKAGSEHTVTGKKPFTIIIGNALAVNLTYNDKEIDVASYQKQGGVARFKLE